MGFIMLRLAWVLSQFRTQYFLVSTFESSLGPSGVLPRLSTIFLSGRGNSEVKLRQVVFDDWSAIFSSRSKYGTFENEKSGASDKTNI